MELAQRPRNRRAGWLVAGGGALVGLAIGLGIFASFTPSPLSVDGTPVAVAAPVVGAPAPDFELETPEGEAIRLSDLRGRVVALNFWATWCVPCRLEMPDLEARAAAHPDDLTVLGVNFDETAAEVVAFREELGITFPLLLDPGAEIQRLYRVLGYPTTYFVDKEGVIRIQHIGLMSPGEMDRYLQEMGLTP